MSARAQLVAALAGMRYIHDQTSAKLETVKTVDEAKPIVEDGINRMKALRRELSTIITARRDLRKLKADYGKAMDSYIKSYEHGLKDEIELAEKYKTDFIKYLS